MKQDRELSCEAKLDKMRQNFKSVNNSRNRYREHAEKMRLLIVDMILQTKGWLHEDLDMRASQIINDYNNLRDGIQ